MDEQPNNDNQMQEPEAFDPQGFPESQQREPNVIIERLNTWAIRVSEQVFIWMQRLFVWLQKVWDWYQSIDWPEIPLTSLQWVLLFYAIFGLLFMVSTPIFEASDELWHFGMVEYIAENDFALPEIDVSVSEDSDLSVAEQIHANNRDTIYRQEGSQPPLYYVASAIAISPFDISDAESYRMPNPHVQAGVPGSWRNKNLVLHEVGGPPLTGTPLAVYTLRLLGLVMGAVTVLAVYQCGRLISPQRPVVGLVAAAFTAFNPMFLFISASVNNDNLVIMLNSLAIWLALKTMREGFDVKWSAGIAVLIALATLTKLSALVLIPVIAVGAIWVAYRDKDWQGLIVLGVMMVVAWGAIAGWWYFRNIQLYGELFGTQTMAQVAGVRENPFTIGTAFAEFQGFRLSYWGVFGAFNIQTTSLFYAIADFMVFVSLFGVMFLVAQLIAVKDFSFARRELTLLLFVLGIELVGFIAFFNWTRLTYATQGRLLFPFMAAISPLLAVGLVEVVWWILFLLSPPDRSFVRAGEAVPERVLNQSMRWPVFFIGIIAFLIPITTIRPQYTAPRPQETIPAGLRAVDADYGDIHLIAYDAIDRRYFPGETVRLTFYWEVEAQTEEDLSIGITLINPEDGTPIGGIDTYPGGGTLRTSTWEEGKIYADTYQIPLSRVIAGRFPFEVQVNWYSETPDDTLPAVDAEGNTLESVELDVGAVIESQPNLNLSRFTPVEVLRVDTDGATTIEPSDRDFQSEILINGFMIDPRSFTIDLQWESKSNLNENYTAFLHVVDSEGRLVGQADVFPTLPTRYWRFGENYITTHHITFRDPETGLMITDEELPLGEYTLLTGWYVNDGEEYPRLVITPAMAEDDEFLDAFELFSFEKVSDRIYLWPDYSEPEDDEEATEEPDSEATGEVGRFIEVDLDEPEVTPEPFPENFMQDDEDGSMDMTDEAQPDSDATEESVDVTETPED